MKLENGKRYRANDGSGHTIRGTVTEYPNYCWAESGYWFVRESGQHVGFRQLYSRPGRPLCGEYYICGPEDFLSLVSEVPHALYADAIP